MNRYVIIVFWSKEDGAWVADVPDLKSCSAFGATPKEAVAEVRVAMDAWLAAARDAGYPVPKATDAASLPPPVSKAPPSTR
jgi:predicted RNase H-like HicB family nuclease